MKAVLSALAFLFPAQAYAADGPVHKVVLIAGAADKGHPAGTHEYAKTVKLLKHCLDAAHIPGLKTEVYLDGWPNPESTLDDAASIVFVTSGADRKTEDHPLLVGDRLATLGKQMKRGCGIVFIHWSVFVPNEKSGEKILDWLGGYFDYQSGPAANGWYSKIQTLATRAVLGDATHPICRGLRPFEVKEEFYYHLRMRDKDPKIVPILTASIPKEEGDQVVAWALERKDGGRGFGFTGGHFFDNWKLDEYRRMVLNAIVWTAHGEVPKMGIDSKMPTAVELEDVIAGPPPDPNWTPPPKPGKVEAWEKYTDKDWIDQRFRMMKTGPFFNATFDYAGPKGKVKSYKGTAIRLGEGGVLFDRGQLRLAAWWTDGWLDISDRRFGLLNTPSPAGKILYTSPSGPGWANENGKWEVLEQAPAHCRDLGGSTRDFTFMAIASCCHIR